MFFKRKIYDKMTEWKAVSCGSTALLIEGARRVGKSSIVEEFAKREYASSILIDFNRPKEGVVDAIVNHPDDLDGLFNLLMVSYGRRLERRKSLIVFDEVQKCPQARQLIKYLVADGRYDYIETGSLISIKKNVKGITIPSEEESIGMFPMDFEEFCWAVGDSISVDFARKAFVEMRPMGEAIHKAVMKRFREYLLVGGMPQAVDAYVKTCDFGRVDRIKRSILKLYGNDISKYAGIDAPKIRGIFEQIPGQLSKKEKKYMLSAVDADARMREYAKSFRWLSESHIVNIARNATDPNVALALSEDFATQKVYSSDTGLLIAQTFASRPYTENELYRALMLDKLSVNEGMIAENAVAQAFAANGVELYFYSRPDRGDGEGRVEIDFLLRKGDMICPVEVKSGAYQHHASLDKFVKKFKDRLDAPCILYTKDLVVKDGIRHLPIYMAMFL
ncbi:MAG: ATP-binding protein [Kiritimatiellae bacterium]|nr:ATP-binding protein [Kiritimatiellia bacterium]